MTLTTAEKLMFITGPDGLDLTGALFGEPAGRDLVVLTHGNGDRFCDQGYVRIGRELAARGHALLTGDTRGRDIIAFQELGDELVAIGAAFERFADSIGDVSAWLTAGREFGPRRLVTAGHSLGAAKAVKALPGSGAAGLLLLSPAVIWGGNSERIRLAGELVAAGRGGEFMPPHPDGPQWNVLTANTLHERAEMIETVFTDAAAPWGSVDIPTLVIYGGGEEGNDENIAHLTAGWSGKADLTCRITSGGGHFFAGFEAEVADVIDEWLAGLS
jgi:dienelactone hydrolase